MKNLLNVTNKIAIYIIHKETHKILFYNDQVKEIFPQVEPGTICHELRCGSCKNCPLKFIGSRNSYTTVNYDSPFGEVVDITATKLMWGEQIPAYLITVVPYRVYQDENKDARKKYQKSVESTPYRLMEYDTRIEEFVRQQDSTEEENRKVFVFEYDALENIIRISNSFQRKFQKEEEIVSAQEVLRETEFIHNDDKKIIEKVMQQCMSQKSSIRCELRLRIPAGEYESYEVYANSLWDEKKDQSVGIFGKLININSLKKEALLWKNYAEKDSLTGIYNRTALQERITDLLEGQDEISCGTLIFIDIDNFKGINDTYGHPVGDELLSAVANRIWNCFRETDIVARYGGDEFIIYVQNLCDPIKLEMKMKQLCGVFRKEYRMERGNINVSGSIGAACFPRDGSDYKTLLKKADIALYEAKKKGKDRYTIYSNEM